MADPTTRNGPGHHLKEVRVRTNVRDTSLEAYEDIRPKPRNNQTIVYSLLAQKGPLTDREIAVTLGWEINCVTGRRNDLVQTGGIVDRGKRECTIQEGRNGCECRRFAQVAWVMRSRTGSPTVEIAS